MLAQSVTPTRAVTIRKLGHATTISTAVATMSEYELGLMRKEKKDKINKKNSSRLHDNATKVVWLPQDIRDARRVKFFNRTGRRRRDRKMRLIWEVRSTTLIDRHIGGPWYTDEEYPGLKNRR